MKCKALLIDVAERSIREVEYDPGGEVTLQKLVGGWVQIGYEWPDTKDVLFVDEEGLLKEQRHFFRLSVIGNPHPLAGHGVIVGRELYADDGETYLGTAPPTITVEQLTPLVQFISRDQFDSWAKGNASEPAAVFYTLDANDRIVDKHVIERVGKMAEHSRPKHRVLIVVSDEVLSDGSVVHNVAVGDLLLHAVTLQDASALAFKFKAAIDEHTTEDGVVEFRPGDSLFFGG